jgi:hypothetical protein
MSTAAAAAIPRPRLDPPGGGRILTRHGLGRMLAQLHAAAQPRLQVQGAAAAAGNALTLPKPGDDRDSQAALDLRARELQATIPGRGRLVTKAAFAVALAAFVRELGFELSVSGAAGLTEDSDGGLSLRVRRRAFNVYIFIQVEIFDTLTGNVLRDVALGSRFIRATEILSSTSEWEFTQMLNLPAADPPRSRNVSVTFWARYRSPAFTGDPAFDDANLVVGPPVALDLKQYNRSSSVIHDTIGVLINDPEGVTVSFSVSADDSGDELLPTELTVI